jgi:hypothetical protein
MQLCSYQATTIAVAKELLGDVCLPDRLGTVDNQRTLMKEKVWDS